METLRLAVDLTVCSSETVNTSVTARKNDKNVWQIETTLYYLGGGYDAYGATPTLILKFSDGSSAKFTGTINEELHHVIDFTLDETAFSQVGLVTCEVVLTEDTSTLHLPFFTYNVADTLEG